VGVVPWWGELEIRSGCGFANVWVNCTGRPSRDRPARTAWDQPGPGPPGPGDGDGPGPGPDGPGPGDGALATGASGFLAAASSVSAALAAASVCSFCCAASSAYCAARAISCSTGDGKLVPPVVSTTGAASSSVSSRLRFLWPLRQPCLCLQPWCLSDPLLTEVESGSGAGALASSTGALDGSDASPSLRIHRNLLGQRHVGVRWQ
jgi:hypothetical protein